MEKDILIYLVDDDALFLKSLEIEFNENSGNTVKTFSTGEKCLEELSQKPDFIVLDYYLNGIDKTAMNGLETLIRIKEAHANLPVVILSAQDNIEVAVNCMKHKAFDYIVKNETSFIRLQKAISTFFLLQKMEKTLSWYMEKS
jgi:DNA-binding NtrC family response regulator